MFEAFESFQGHRPLRKLFREQHAILSNGVANFIKNSNYIPSLHPRLLILQRELSSYKR